MTLPTQPFRDEHAELLEHIEHIREAARKVGRAPPDERKALVDQVLAFLRGTLVPHARAEEEVLYPEWSRLVGYAGAAEPMIHDHEAIVARSEALANTSPEAVDDLQELLYGLHSLISVHFRKEEEIQLPALDEHPAIAKRVLEQMGAHGGHTH